MDNKDKKQCFQCNGYGHTDLDGFQTCSVCSGHGYRNNNGIYELFGQNGRNLKILTHKEAKLFGVEDLILFAGTHQECLDNFHKFK